MTSLRARRLPGPDVRAPVGSQMLLLPPWMVAGLAVVGAAIMGLLLADHHTTYGVGVIVIAVYGTLVFFNLALALSVWVVILFFAGLSALSHGPNTVGLLMFLGWVGTFIGRRDVRGFLQRNRRMLLRVLMFGVWLTLTVAWASRPSSSSSEVGYWWLGILVFLIVLTTVEQPHHARYIAYAFLIGSVISVAIGVGSGGLAAPGAVSQTAVNGRLTGGGTDPNEQASAFIAAMFLSVGMFSVVTGRMARRCLLGAFLVITFGFFATQSRGGLIALLVAAVAAILLAPEQRRRILALMSVVALASGVLLVADPGIVHRITNVGGGTSGRGDLWRVAWEIFRTNPLFGVGVGNFQVLSGSSHFVLGPGAISRIQYLAETPQVAHNTYLQLLAETGVVGLLGYLFAVVGILRTYSAASRRFAQIGRPEYADLSRAAMMGTIGFLAANFFITNGWSYRLWVLLALGPALLAMATRMRGGDPAEHGLRGGGPTPVPPPPVPWTAATPQSTLRPRTG